MRLRHGIKFNGIIVLKGSIIKIVVKLGSPENPLFKVRVFSGTELAIRRIILDNKYRAYWQTSGLCIDGHPKTSGAEQCKGKLAKRFLRALGNFIGEIGGYYYRSVNDLEEDIRKAINKNL